MKLTFYPDLDGPTQCSLVPYMYTHGQAETLCKIDLIEASPDVHRKLKCLHPGIHNCTFRDARGRTHAAKLYFWRAGSINRGLVIRNGDRKGHAYARRLFCKRASWF